MRWARGGILQPVCDNASAQWGLGRRKVAFAIAHAPIGTSALLEVSRVVWVVGVCGPTDFDMALDGGAGGSIKSDDLRVALLLSEPDAEEPTFGRHREVLALLPGGGFVGVASFGPAQQLPKDITVKPVKGPLGSSVSVVVSPAPDEGVELAEERLLWESQSGLDAEPDFVPEGSNATLCGTDQEFVPKLAHGVPQKVKALLDVGDDEIGRAHV